MREEAGEEGISVQARDELVSGVRGDAQADGDEAWAPVARPVADCGARAGESDLILVSGTASPRSWYWCSTYPVLQGFFFHS